MELKAEMATMAITQIKLEEDLRRSQANEARTAAKLVAEEKQCRSLNAEISLSYRNYALLEQRNGNTIAQNNELSLQNGYQKFHLCEYRKLQTKFAELMAMFEAEVDKRKAAEAAANTAVTMQNILDAVNTIVARGAGGAAP